MLHVPLRLPTVGEQEKASRHGRKSQQGREQFFHVSLARLNLRPGAVSFEPFAPVWGFLRIRGENEDAIPAAGGQLSLSHRLHPMAHAGGYALRKIKDENSLFFPGLPDNPLWVGEAENEEQKNHGSSQNDE